MEEQYLPVFVGPNQKIAMNRLPAEASRIAAAGRASRLKAGADVAEIGRTSRMEGRLEQISE